MKHARPATTRFCFDDVVVIDTPSTSYWEFKLVGFPTPNTKWYDLRDPKDLVKLESIPVLHDMLVKIIDAVGGTSRISLTSSKERGMYLTVKHTKKVSGERDKLMRAICRIIASARKKCAVLVS